MPFEVHLTRDAARDLEEIDDYIGRHDGPGRADYVLLIADGRRDMQTLLQRRLLQA